MPVSKPRNSCRCQSCSLIGWQCVWPRLGKQKVLPFPGPDGKSQVTVEYRDGKPVRVDYVVLACQHTPDVVTPDGRFMTEEAKRQVIDEVARPGARRADRRQYEIHGQRYGYVSGGGTASRHRTYWDTISLTRMGVGQCMEGVHSAEKTRPKSIARPGRWRDVAKNIVAAGLADECLLQLRPSHRPRRSSLRDGQYLWHRTASGRGTFVRQFATCSRFRPLASSTTYG